ncbi:hypothetical protein JXB02_05400 [Candidatus Woesearchaeota archaeon]|nr:hypothetical protein [Candidatus Woesearchaeota archaeon]
MAAWLAYAITLIITFLAICLLIRLLRRLSGRAAYLPGVRICPRCGSTDISPRSPGSGGASLTGVLPDRYVCNGCGYLDLFPTIGREGVVAFRKEIEKRRKNAR